MRKALLLTVCMTLMAVGNPAFAQRDLRGGDIGPNPGMGYLSVIHAIPGLPEKVEVFVNGDFAFAFDYQDRIGPLALDAGYYQLQVRLQGVTVLSEKTRILADTNSTAIAHLTESSGIKLAVFENNLEGLDRGSSRLIVRHTAAAPEVTVTLQSTRSLGRDSRITIPGFANGDQIGPVDIAAGDYSAGLSLDRVEVFNSGIFNLPSDATTVIYAIGEFPNTFELFVEEYR